MMFWINKHEKDDRSILDLEPNAGEGIRDENNIFSDFNKCRFRHERTDLVYLELIFNLILFQCAELR